MPFRLLLPRRLYEEMVAQAVAELPNECCGLLAGRIEPVAAQDAERKPVARVMRKYPLVNKAASPTEYDMSRTVTIHGRRLTYTIDDVDQWLTRQHGTIV